MITFTSAGNSTRESVVNALQFRNVTMRLVVQDWVAIIESCWHHRGCISFSVVIRYAFSDVTKRFGVMDMQLCICHRHVCWTCLCIIDGDARAPIHDVVYPFLTWPFLASSVHSSIIPSTTRFRSRLLFILPMCPNKLSFIAMISYRITFSVSSSLKVRNLMLTCSESAHKYNISILSHELLVLH